MKKAIFALLFFIITIPTFAQWFEREYLGGSQPPDVSDILQFTFPTQNTGYYVLQGNISVLGGDFATVQKSSDYGETWQQLFHMNEDYYISVGGIASYQPDTVYFCYSTNGGVKLKYSFNGGDNWSQTSIGGPGLSSLMYLLNSQTAYIFVSYYSKTLINPYSLWRVDSLVPQLINDSIENRIIQMCFLDTITGYSIQNISYPNYGLFSTNDGGRSWSLLQSQLDPSAAIYFTSHNNGYISSGLSLYRTTDGGLSLTELNTPNLAKINKVYCTTDSTIYCIGDGGEYMMTSDYGINWTLESIITNYSLKQIQMFDDGYGYISNAGQMLYSNILVESVPATSITIPSIYPNPSKDFISLKGIEGLDYKRIEIYNPEGIRIISTVDSHNIDVSELTPGIYIVAIISDDSVQNTKFIKW